MCLFFCLVFSCALSCLVFVLMMIFMKFYWCQTSCLRCVAKWATKRHWNEQSNEYKKINLFVLNVHSNATEISLKHFLGWFDINYRWMSSFFLISAEAKINLISDTFVSSSFTSRNTNKNKNSWLIWMSNRPIVKLFVSLLLVWNQFPFQISNH